MILIPLRALIWIGLLLSILAIAALGSGKPQQQPAAVLTQPDCAAKK